MGRINQLFNIPRPIRALLLKIMDSVIPIKIRKTLVRDNFGRSARFSMMIFLFSKKDETIEASIKTSKTFEGKLKIFILIR